MIVEILQSEDLHSKTCLENAYPARKLYEDANFSKAGNVKYGIMAEYEKKVRQILHEIES